jgi:formiminoglutamase
MSGESTSAAGSFTRLRPYARPEGAPRPDDPRLADVVRFGPVASPAPGTAVIVGFPQDEGVRRNGGRVGAAEAPDEIRRWLYRMVAVEGRRGVVDLGDVVVSRDLESDQLALAEVVGDLLRLRAVPIVLGGGHEAAFGVYLGHALAGPDVGIINLDAHLDVRPADGGLGHSGSPFRQAMEHATPLPGPRYVCLGAQPFSVSRAHLDYVRSRGGKVFWRDDVEGRLLDHLAREAATMPSVHLSIDADVVTAAEVPGVSAPNPAGLTGVEVIKGAKLAGSLSNVVSLELVEINPRLDADGRSARWGALVVWQFLNGLAARPAA